MQNEARKTPRRDHGDATKRGSEMLPARTGKQQKGFVVDSKVYLRDYCGSISAPIECLIETGRTENETVALRDSGYSAATSERRNSVPGCFARSDSSQGEAGGRVQRL